MNQPRRTDRVTAPRRPPVRQPTMVRSDRRHTFDEQLAQDCALPGGYASGAYSAGWTRILDRFAAAMATASDAASRGTGGPQPPDHLRGPV